MPISRVNLLLVQFWLTLSWTIYAVFLPQLAERAGVAAAAVSLLLMLDQALFALGDLAAGVAVDKTGARLGAIGRPLALASLLSCLAFVLLPWLADTGGTVLLLLTGIWTLSSSALRAPVFALLGKHAPQPAFPGLAATAMLGLGLAGALAPLLTAELRKTDPALPFALASISLGLATLLLLRSLPAPNAAMSPTTSASPPAHGRAAMRLILIAVPAALAFQIHANLNSPAFYKRLADGNPDHLMPLFWIGFSLALVPAGMLMKRHAASSIMGAAALLGASTTFLAGQSSSLGVLAPSQLLAGAAWALFLLPALSLAVDLGRSGAEGRSTGRLFALLALVSMGRIALGWLRLPADPAWAGWFVALPPLGWLLCAVMLFLWRTPAAN